MVGEDQYTQAFAAQITFLSGIPVKLCEYDFNNQN